MGLQCGAILAFGPRKGQPCPCRPVSGTEGFCGRHQSPWSTPSDPSEDCTACMEPTLERLSCKHPLCKRCQGRWFAGKPVPKCPYCVTPVQRRGSRAPPVPSAQATRIANKVANIRNTINEINRLIDLVRAADVARAV